MSMNECRNACIRELRTCEEIPLDGQFETGLGQLVNELAKERDSIPRDAILEMFDEPGDPCNRSALHRKDGRLFNRGESCLLDVLDANADEVGMNFILPVEITADPVANSHFSYAVEFPNVEQAPSVEVVDGKEHSAGNVRSAAYSKNHLYIIFNSNCILAQHEAK